MSTSNAEELALLLKSGWKAIAIETFEENRVVKLAEVIAKASELEVIVWTSAGGLNQGSGAGTLEKGLAAVAACSQPAIFVMLDAHTGFSDPLALRRLRDLLPVLEERRQAIFLTGPIMDIPIELAREIGRVKLPLPNTSELEAILRSAVKNPEDRLLGSAVRAALGLTGTEALRVFRKCCFREGKLNDAAIQGIVREKREALRRTPALAFHEADGGLAEIGGLGELKHWLHERSRAFSEDAAKFGLPTPKGLLLLGVQGCGKSLAAKAISREWQFPLLRLDLAAAFGGGGQSPELTIREAILVAESVAPAVLWIDEIEKGFSASDSDPSASRVFGSFLTWLSEKRTPVFVAATANDIKSLPPELLRRGRFDELFFVDLPSAGERAEILSIHLRKRNRDPLQFPIEDLAAKAERLSGSELEEAVNSALYTAFAENRDVHENDLANAIHETVPLYDTYEDRIKELRDWARTRARPASVDARMVDLFVDATQEAAADQINNLDMDALRELQSD